MIYGDFINDCIETDENGFVKLEDTFRVFKNWWKENYSGQTPSRKDMKMSLEKKLGKYLPSPDGGWSGYKLVSPDSNVSNDSESKFDT